MSTTSSHDKGVGVIKQIKNPKLYFVEWQDAHSASGWHTDKQVEEFINQEKCLCDEIGWLISETKDEIVMAARRLKWKKED